MSTGRLLSDELLLPDAPTQCGHPRDVSRLLLGLMALASKADEPRCEKNEDGLNNIISRVVLRSLLSALHFRDVATVRHSRRVAMLAVGMAHYLRWDPAQQKMLEVAALLHDIGKIGVPDNILFKPGKLSPDEAELMALHHHIGIDVLQACRANAEVIEIIMQAHSHYRDGSGGFRRTGGEIHQGARILAVADAYDSMRTDQVYRDGKPHDEIMSELTEASGTQFDGNVVTTLARWIDSEGLPFEQDFSGAPQPFAAPGPNRPEDALEASSLGHIFSYLYVLESLYDGFYLVDSDLRFVVWNHGCERLMAQSSHDMLHQVWTSRTFNYTDKYGEKLQDDQCAMNRVVGDGRPTTSTVQIRRPDGTLLEVELQTVPLLDEDGHLHGVAEIFRDQSRSNRPPREYRELKLAASRDALTSVANRGELETQLALMVAEFSQRPDDEPLSIIFLDVDFFKGINDNYGHAFGDQVLIDIARLLQHETYSGELVGRYGGEEFVILCPATDMDQAVRKAERLRVAISRSEIGGDVSFPVTASFGVSEAEPGDSVESILRRADKALYMAKKGGRNKTCSLTNEELLSGRLEQEQSSKESQDPYAFTGKFQACIAADMIVYKLGGFVNDQNAKLAEVSPKRAVVRVGSQGLLPFWGRSDERQPIEMVVEFGEEQRGQRPGKRGAAREVSVDVSIRPIGWVRDSNVFQNRAKRVMKTLRSFFASN